MDTATFDAPTRILGTRLTRAMRRPCQFVRGDGIRDHAHHWVGALAINAGIALGFGLWPILPG